MGGEANCMLSQNGNLHPPPVRTGGGLVAGGDLATCTRPVQAPGPGTRPGTLNPCYSLINIMFHDAYETA